jgi:hypothetical protein
VAVTKQVKPTGRRYQTATQVKGLSPVIINVKEVDSFHILEDNTIYVVLVRDRLLFRGLRPWYDIGRKLQELGRPCLLLGDRTFANNQEKRECGEGKQGVGSTHSRGVVSLTGDELDSQGHSKGLTLLCKGKGRHSQTTELEKLWKQNCAL